jgi:ribokinase
MGKILVVGSSNTDLIAKVKAFPGAGETILGKSFLQAMGGKGANQAVAAHKLGGDVKFVTCLGKDPNGLNTMKYLSETGLDVSSSLLIEGVPSGTAIILVDDNGENCIVITPGANNMLLPAHIREISHDIEVCDMVVMQMEIPYETVRTVCEMAVLHKKKILLNVAPASPLDSGLMQLVDILVVNETEAEVITGEKIDDIGDAEMIDRLLDMGAKSVVLTLGRKGCLMKNHREFHTVPAYRVKAVDSTAAGDTFCGSLAAVLCRGNQWEDALRFATAASAICVTRMGAQPSIPTEKEVLEFLKLNQEPAHR